MASGAVRPPLPPGPFLVVGLARSGVAAAVTLRALGERVYGTDTGNPPDAGRLADLGVELELDGDGTRLLDEVKTVVKSPGVPPDAPVVTEARERGLDVIGELELGWRLLPNRFISVTGTNGKTTVSEWLGHVLRGAGTEVAVAGNVGTPLASLSGSLDPEATVVCECSSFQLEDSVAFGPEVAVLLNVTPDHLDRHKTLASYAEAKLRIFANQGTEDTAIVDADDSVVGKIALPGEAIREPYGIDACADEQRCAVSYVDGEIRDSGGVLVRGEDLPLAGEHNVRNAMAVATAALAAGTERAHVASGLRTFGGVPHRLERVRELDGIVFVNDSKATNAAAAAAALEAFGSGVHVILGGSRKGGGFEELAPAVAAHCSACYLIGEAAPKLRADLSPAGVPLLDSGDLASALTAAAAAAVSGETVLLAPACASFDAFRDYEERGDRFRELVAELGEGS